MLFLHPDTSHRLVGKRKLIQTLNYRSPEQTDLQQVIASFRKFVTSLADGTTVRTSKILISPGALQQQKGKNNPQSNDSSISNSSISTPNTGGLSPHAEANSTCPHFLSCSVQKKSLFSTLNSMLAIKY